MSEQLTIAQALRKIKKLKGNADTLLNRAKAVVTFDTSRVPEFNFQETSDELFNIQNLLVKLESQVAFANATTKIKNIDNSDVTISYAIRSLQEMKGRISFFNSLVIRNEVEKTSETVYDEINRKYVQINSERVFKSPLTLKMREALVKALQDDFEELNNRVEAANHRTLLE